MCVSGLRRALAPTKLGAAIATRPPGYLLRISDGQLDADVFDAMMTGARSAAAAGRQAEAADRLRGALGLWRGPALAGVSGWVVRAAATRLEERRLHALEERIRLDLQLGRHEELVGELRTLVAEHPLNERLCADLMLALYRSGRPVEALEAYRQARLALVHDLGIEPGEELQRLERAVLSRLPELELTAPVSGGRGPDGPSPVAPRQLPSDIADFTGRERLVSSIRATVTGAAPERSALPVVAVAGPGGVGKSALAVHAAHLLAAEFPDGQLYATLQHGDRPVGPADVLARFLTALGVAGAVIPDGLDERAEMYRSRVAGRRILVVLDDGADESQVLPLLPGSASCAVVVTSRVRLTGLPGAHHVRADVFDTATAVELLGKIAGTDRVRAEPAAAASLAGLCGGLPLALRIVGARLAGRPHWRLGRMVERLRDETRRLDELEHANLGIRPSISLSYLGLPEPAQRLLRRLAGLDAPDVAGWVAAALLDVDPDSAEDVLERLTDAQLLEADADPATGVVRYRFHDLVRVFARERLAADETPAQARVAVVRALGAWLALAEEGHRREYGGDYSILHGDFPRWPVPAGLAARLLVKPLAWYESERAGLVAAVRQAGSWSLDELCWDLALTAMTLFEAKNHFADWWDTTEVALAVTRQAANRRGEAAMLYSRGFLHGARRQLDEARVVLESALRAFEACRDEHGQALVLNDLGFVDRLQGRSASATIRFDRALTGLRAVGDRVAEGTALHNMAGLLLDADDHAAAETLLDDALTTSRAAGGRRVEAQVLYRLGELYLDRDEWDRSEHAFHSVLQIVRDRGDRVGEAHGLHGLGRVRARTGNHDEAQSSLDQALRLARQIGDRLAEARILFTLGELHVEQRRYRLAEERLTESCAVFGQFGSVVWQAKALIALRGVHSARNDPLAASRATASAAGLLAEVDSAEARQLLGRLTSARS